MHACPIRQNDSPKEVSLVSSSCGYSHNKQIAKSLNVQEVVAPPWQICICVRPLNRTRYPNLKNIHKVAQWIENWRMVGADQLYMYHGDIAATIKHLLKVYEKEALPFVHTTDWSAIMNNVDPIVGDEAAINYCLYEHMMKCRHILVTSFDEVLLFGTKHKDLKGLLKDTFLQDNMQESGGFRITSVGSSSDREAHPSILMKSQAVLATASNYFIPLSGHPHFKVLGWQDVLTVPLNTFMDRQAPIDEDMKKAMAQAAVKRVAKALTHDKTKIKVEEKTL